MWDKLLKNPADLEPTHTGSLQLTEEAPLILKIVFLCVVGMILKSPATHSLSQVLAVVHDLMLVFSGADGHQGQGSGAGDGRGDGKTEGGGEVRRGRDAASDQQPSTR